MCRPRLQVEGAETHSPVVHQLQNSTTASNGVIQLKKKKKKKKQKPITTQPGAKTSPAEILHKEISIGSIHKARFQRREHKTNSQSARKSPCITWLGVRGSWTKQGAKQTILFAQAPSRACICLRIPYQIARYGLRHWNGWPIVRDSISVTRSCSSLCHSVTTQDFGFRKANAGSRLTF